MHWKGPAGPWADLNCFESRAPPARAGESAHGAEPAALRDFGPVYASLGHEQRSRSGRRFPKTGRKFEVLAYAAKHPRGDQLAPDLILASTCLRTDLIG